jgi:hypothetical protein
MQKVQRLPLRQIFIRIQNLYLRNQASALQRIRRTRPNPAPAAYNADLHSFSSLSFSRVFSIRYFLFSIRRFRFEILKLQFEIKSLLVLDLEFGFRVSSFEFSSLNRRSA